VEVVLQTYGGWLTKAGARRHALPSGIDIALANGYTVCGKDGITKCKT
jgi:hypothetical protein